MCNSTGVAGSTQTDTVTTVAVNNTGSTATDKVRELQRALYRAAKADPKRRFHALYD